ncbi:30S ribosomal protein S6e [archaeon SCG-AAA382B04]|nr:30S ribosomal protein S6e [archaeon SCG-AAA382B04]
MAEFKLVISNPKNGETYQKNVSEANANSLIAKKLGQEIEGEKIGISNYSFKIVGGTDSDGFPMRPGIEGSQRRKVLLTQGPGFNSKRKGERRKKSVRGNEISESITQINLVVTNEGEEELEELI